MILLAILFFLKNKIKILWRQSHGVYLWRVKKLRRVKPTVAVGMEFPFPFPSHSHRNPVGIPIGILWESP